MPNATSGRAVWHDPVMAEALARFPAHPAAGGRALPLARRAAARRKREREARRDAEQEIQALAGGQEDSAPAFVLGVGKV
jgi:hypothetical protein